MDQAAITFRPETRADEPFLLRLYASTRAYEMSIVPWVDAQKTAFLTSQFALQTHHYRKYYPDAAFLIVEREGNPIGRFYVDRSGERVLLIDIALLPEFRGGGIGGKLMAALLAEAGAKRQGVEIHVEINNPAKRLYDRLGFQVVEETGMHFRMQWTPDGPAHAQKAGPTAI